MIPVDLGLGSLIAKVAAVAAISRLVKALGASPEKGTPPVTSPPSNLAPQGISSGIQDPKTLSSRGSALPELRSSSKNRLQNGLPAVFGERGERAVVKEYNGNGTVKASYFLGATGRQAIKVDGAWYIYLRDTHGSMTGLVDQAGNRVATYESDPYGEPIVDQGTVYNPYRWNGEPLDAESGLTYMRNRYYQASTGRFIQRDPISYAGGLNLYSYCGGDPVNLSDPSGLEPSPWPYVKGGNMGSLRRPAPPRVVYYQQEGVTGLSAADHMMAGLLINDLRWLGKSAGGFAARAAVAEDTWVGAGKLVRAAGSKGGTAAEEAFAAQLARSGRHVETRFGLQGVDFVVEGVEWEFKGMTKLGPDTLKSAIETAVKDNKASRIFIDASEFEVNEAYVTSTMNRLHGNGFINQINDVIIYGKDVVYRYNYH